MHVVTDNRVQRLPDDEPAAADGVLADLVRRAEALDAQGTTGSPPRPLGLASVGALLTVVLALLGRQAWQLPERGPSGVTGIPQSLLTFLLLCAAMCVWTAGRLVRPTETLRSTSAAQLWWGLVAGVALVSVTADLSLGSFAGTGQRPDDLLLRCLVPLVPAVLAGMLARTAGRATR